MAHSIEVRPPFLDHRIVEFAASLPAHLQIHGSRQKVILKNLMRGKLPPSVLSRKKVGFDIPAHEWFRGPAAAAAARSIGRRGRRACRLFPLRPDPWPCEQAHQERRANLGYHLWGLLTLLLWMKKWRIQTIPLSGSGTNSGKSPQLYLIVLLFAAAVYVGCMVSPPSLMDDVDAVQAQIARNMLTSGDWVTARIDGIAYLEKAPLIYWLMAISFKIFGPYDWAARIPVVLAALALAWLTAAFGIWAFGKRAGFYAGLCIATCVGLFLFTRILIPDVMVTARHDALHVGVSARHR